MTDFVPKPIRKKVSLEILVWVAKARNCLLPRDQAARLAEVAAEFPPYDQHPILELGTLAALGAEIRRDGLVGTFELFMG